MFTWLNKQGVKSDKGFIVQRTDRFSCDYREGVKKIEIEVESGLIGDQFCINVSTKSFSSWHGGESISSEKQAEILQNFKDAMEFQGLKVIVY